MQHELTWCRAKHVWSDGGEPSTVHRIFGLEHTEDMTAFCLWCDVPVSRPKHYYAATAVAVADAAASSIAATAGGGPDATIFSEKCLFFSTVICRFTFEMVQEHKNICTYVFW